MKTSSIRFGFKFIASKAPLIAAAPNFVADIEEREPPKLPIGVLFAATITTFFIFKFSFNFSYLFYLNY